MECFIKIIIIEAARNLKKKQLEYITKLFTTEIAMYDGAMGTMIQNYSKKNKLDDDQLTKLKRQASNSKEMPSVVSCDNERGA